jgi:hypothetical protein
MVRSNEYGVFIFVAMILKRQEHTMSTQQYVKGLECL